MSVFLLRSGVRRELFSMSELTTALYDLHPHPHIFLELYLQRFFYAHHQGLECEFMTGLHARIWLLKNVTPKGDLLLFADYDLDDGEFDKRRQWMEINCNYHRTYVAIRVHKTKIWRCVSSHGLK